MVDRFQHFGAKLIFGTFTLALLGVAGCSTPPAAEDSAALTNNIPGSLSNALRSVKEKFAPDSHMVVFKVEAIHAGNHYALRGDVENAEAKTAALAAAHRTGLRVEDEISVVPDKKLGNALWGIASFSVVNVREKPLNSAEMGSQVLTGDIFKVWKRQTNWYLVQTADNYVGYVEAGGFTNCDRATVDRWQAAPHLILTAWEERILERPSDDAMPVSDLVMGSQVERLGESRDWYRIGLPDGRSGYIPKKSAMDFAEWKASRHPTPENIEHTARLFVGRPYVWGCNSIRGMDCSGLTKLTFFLNGMELNRNASEQCQQGVEIPLGDDYQHLKKGDLLFFGHPARRGRPERIDHAAIYLGDKLFIQSSGMVKISSLDPASPICDLRHTHTLLHARRVLAEQ